MTSTMGEVHVDQNYSKCLAAMLNEYRKSRFMCDVILVAPPKECMAHRNILCAASPYFLECLGSDSLHTTLGSKVELKNIVPEIMEDLLNFMYIGEICVGEENVRKLISASDILKMEKLKDVACRFYEKRLCPSNCLSIAALADEFNCDTLRAAADQFILQNFLDVSKYEEFKSLTCSHVVRLLSSNDINVSQEEQVFSAAMDWIDYRSQERMQYLSTILGCIRLLHTSRYFISDVLENDENLMSDPGCVRIINEAKLIFDFPDRAHMIKHKKQYEPRTFSDITSILISCAGNQERMSTNEVLCYIPSQDFWYPLAPLIQSRFGSSSLVKHNEIYCIGGKVEGKSTKRIEKYNFNLDRWVETVQLPQPLCNHVTCIFNGDIYVIGGGEHETSSSNVIKYLSGNGKWVKVKDMKVPRRAAAVAVHKNLYVIGGYDTQGQPLASVERYNPYSNEWAKIFPMNSARACASSVCIEDNIYVFGGEYAMWSYYRSAEVFNIKTDEWKSISDLSIPRAFMGITAHHDKIYLVGGMVSGAGSDQYGAGDDEDEFVDVNESNLVECYDIATNTWKKLCSLPVATAGANCSIISVSLAYLESKYGF